MTFIGLTSQEEEEEEIKKQAISDSHIYWIFREDSKWSV